MVYLPIPHRNELIYSIIARYKVRSGITSPKLLLDEVFGNRKVVSTLDLPCFINSIENHFPDPSHLSCETLIYKHTLFPIYAPFVDEKTRQKALNYMQFSSQGAAHMSLGVAASVVKAVNRLSLCFHCVKNQVALHGEGYWDRAWFLPLLPYCCIHGRLTTVDYDIQRFRHEYIVCSNFYRNDPPKSKNIPKCLINIVEMANELFNLPPMSSPSKDQWTAFYRQLAEDNLCTKGKSINHEAIFNNLNTSHMPSSLLMNIGNENHWLKSIFRKHRKSFSFLQHIYVWRYFAPELNVKEIFNIVKAISPLEVANKVISRVSVDLDEQSMRRQWWTKRVGELGIKKARFSIDGQACYAWLYRNDSAWLLSFNQLHRVTPRANVQRVDWFKRDRTLSLLLSKLLSRLDSHIDGPRRSKQFLLSHLPSWRSASKNLHRLRRLNCLLNAYQETVEEYQIRRILLHCIHLLKNGQRISNWKLMRLSGLSSSTISPLAQQALKWTSAMKRSNYEYQLSQV